MKRSPRKRDKPGPKEERLIITDDPEDALKRLLRPKDETQKSDDSDKSD